MLKNYEELIENDLIRDQFLRDSNNSAYAEIRLEVIKGTPCMNICIRLKEDHKLEACTEFLKVPEATCYGANSTEMFHHIPFNDSSALETLKTLFAWKSMLEFHFIKTEIIFDLY